MSKLRVRFWIALVPAVILGCSGRPAGEPKAGGKPLGHWLQALHDGDPAVRQKAATKLGNIGGAYPDVVPALATAVQDPVAAVRAEAVLSLLKIGPAAREAVPALTAALKDPDAKVRLHAQKALERLHGT